MTSMSGLNLLRQDVVYEQERVDLKDLIQSEDIMKCEKCNYTARPSNQTSSPIHTSVPFTQEVRLKWLEFVGEVAAFVY